MAHELERLPGQAAYAAEAVWLSGREANHRGDIRDRGDGRNTLVQSGPHVVGRVGPASTFRSDDSHAGGSHAGQAGKSDDFPDGMFPHLPISFPLDGDQ
jgi:hypothetical protein